MGEAFTTPRLGSGSATETPRTLRIDKRGNREWKTTGGRI